MKKNIHEDQLHYEIKQSKEVFLKTLRELINSDDYDTIEIQKKTLQLLYNIISGTENFPTHRHRSEEQDFKELAICERYQALLKNGTKGQSVIKFIFEEEQKKNPEIKGFKERNIRDILKRHKLIKLTKKLSPQAAQRK